MALRRVLLEVCDAEAVSPYNLVTTVNILPLVNHRSAIFDEETNTTDPDITDAAPHSQTSSKDFQFTHAAQDALKVNNEQSGTANTVASWEDYAAYEFCLGGDRYRCTWVENDSILGQVRCTFSARKQSVKRHIQSRHLRLK